MSTTTSPTAICQVCQMPLTSEDLYGTEADGSLNREYCKDCYQDGALVPYCQSCSMPMKTPTDFGTLADGSPSPDYCTYCFQQGEFCNEVTMEEMIQGCADMDFEMVGPDGNVMNREDRVAIMRLAFPTLKRWQPVA